jgi:hypothetical protein
MTTDTNKFQNINLQLQSLLENLTIDGDKVFESVLLGIPNNDFRGYRFPISIIRLVKGTYATETFNKRNTPNWIHTSIGIFCTGEMQESYMQAIKIMDKIQEKFETDRDWITLNGKVRLTEIEQSLVNDIPTEEALMRIVVFNLRHHVYK